MKRILMILTMFIHPQLSFAASKGASALRRVNSILARYREAPAIRAKVKKTIVQELMGNTVTSEGIFYFSKGKLRLEFTAPESSTLVYDGENIWIESRLDEKTVQVTRLHKNEIKKTQSVLTAVFDKKDVFSGMKVTKAISDGKRKSLAFAPKDEKRKNDDIVSLEVVVNDKNLERLKYVDTLENQVSFDFSQVEESDVSLKKFQYHPPKGAEVTEL